MSESRSGYGSGHTTPRDRTPSYITTPGVEKTSPGFSESDPSISSSFCSSAQFVLGDSDTIFEVSTNSTAVFTESSLATVNSPVPTSHNTHTASNISSPFATSRSPTRSINSAVSSNIPDTLSSSRPVPFSPLPSNPIQRAHTSYGAADLHLQSETPIPVPFYTPSASLPTTPHTATLPGPTTAHGLTVPQDLADRHSFTGPQDAVVGMEAKAVVACTESQDMVAAGHENGYGDEAAQEATRGVVREIESASLPHHAVTSEAEAAASLPPSTSPSMSAVPGVGPALPAGVAVAPIVVSLPQRSRSRHASASARTSPTHAHSHVHTHSPTLTHTQSYSSTHGHAYASTRPHTPSQTPPQAPSHSRPHTPTNPLIHTSGHSHIVSTPVILTATASPLPCSISPDTPLQGNNHADHENPEGGIPEDNIPENTPHPQISEETLLPSPFIPLPLDPPFPPELHPNSELSQNSQNPESEDSQSLCSLSRLEALQKWWSATESSQTQQEPPQTLQQRFPYSSCLPCHHYLATRMHYAAPAALAAVWTAASEASTLYGMGIRVVAVTQTTMTKMGAVAKAVEGVMVEIKRAVEMDDIAVTSAVTPAVAEEEKSKKNVASNGSNGKEGSIMPLIHAIMEAQTSLRKIRSRNSQYGYFSQRLRELWVAAGVDGIVNTAAENNVAPPNTQDDIGSTITTTTTSTDTNMGTGMGMQVCNSVWTPVGACNEAAVLQLAVQLATQTPADADSEPVMNMDADVDSETTRAVARVDEVNGERNDENTQKQRNLGKRDGTAGTNDETKGSVTEKVENQKKSSYLSSPASTAPSLATVRVHEKTLRSAIDAAYGDITQPLRSLEREISRKQEHLEFFPREKSEFSDMPKICGFFRGTATGLQKLLCPPDLPCRCWEITFSETSSSSSSSSLPSLPPLPLYLLEPSLSSLTDTAMDTITQVTDTIHNTIQILKQNMSGISIPEFPSIENSRSIEIPEIYLPHLSRLLPSYSRTPSSIIVFILTLLHTYDVLHICLSSIQRDISRVNQAVEGMQGLLGKLQDKLELFVQYYRALGGLTAPKGIPDKAMANNAETSEGVAEDCNNCHHEDAAIPEKAILINSTYLFPSHSIQNDTLHKISLNSPTVHHLHISFTSVMADISSISRIHQYYRECYQSLFSGGTKVRETALAFRNFTAFGSAVRQSLHSITDSVTVAVDVPVEEGICADDDLNGSGGGSLGVSDRNGNVDVSQRISHTSTSTSINISTNVDTDTNAAPTLSSSSLLMQCRHGQHSTVKIHYNERDYTVTIAPPQPHTGARAHRHTQTHAQNNSTTSVPAEDDEVATSTPVHPTADTGTHTRAGTSADGATSPSTGVPTLYLSLSVPHLALVSFLTSSLAARLRDTARAYIHTFLSCYTSVCVWLKEKQRRKGALLTQAFLVYKYSRKMEEIFRMEQKFREEWDENVVEMTLPPLLLHNNDRNPVKLHLSTYHDKLSTASDKSSSSIPFPVPIVSVSSLISPIEHLHAPHTHTAQETNISQHTQDTRSTQSALDTQSTSTTNGNTNTNTTDTTNVNINTNAAEAHTTSPSMSAPIPASVPVPVLASAPISAPVPLSVPPQLPPTTSFPSHPPAPLHLSSPSASPPPTDTSCFTYPSSVPHHSPPHIHMRVDMQTHAHAQTERYAHSERLEQMQQQAYDSSSNAVIASATTTPTTAPGNTNAVASGLSLALAAHRTPAPAPAPAHIMPAQSQSQSQALAPTQASDSQLSSSNTPSSLPSSHSSSIPSSSLHSSRPRLSLSSYSPRLAASSPLLQPLLRTTPQPLLQPVLQPLHHPSPHQPLQYQSMPRSVVQQHQYQQHILTPQHTHQQHYLQPLTLHTPNNAQYQQHQHASPLMSHRGETPNAAQSPNGYESPNIHGNAPPSTPNITNSADAGSVTTGAGTGAGPGSVGMGMGPGSVGTGMGTSFSLYGVRSDMLLPSSRALTASSPYYTASQQHYTASSAPYTASQSQYTTSSPPSPYTASSPPYAASSSPYAASTYPYPASVAIVPLTLPNSTPREAPSTSTPAPSATSASAADNSPGAAHSAEADSGAGAGTGVSTRTSPTDQLGTPQEQQQEPRHTQQAHSQHQQHQQQHYQQAQNHPYHQEQQHHPQDQHHPPHPTSPASPPTPAPSPSLPSSTTTPLATSTLLLSSASSRIPPLPPSSPLLTSLSAASSSPPVSAPIPMPLPMHMRVNTARRRASHTHTPTHAVADTVADTVDTQLYNTHSPATSIPIPGKTLSEKPNPEKHDFPENFPETDSRSIGLLSSRRGPIVGMSGSGLGSRANSYTGLAALGALPPPGPGAGVGINANNGVNTAGVSGVNGHSNGMATGIGATVLSHSPPLSYASGAMPGSVGSQGSQRNLVMGLYTNTPPLRPISGSSMAGNLLHSGNLSNSANLTLSGMIGTSPSSGHSSRVPMPASSPYAAYSPYTVNSHHTVNQHSTPPYPAALHLYPATTHTENNNSTNILTIASASAFTTPPHQTDKTPSDHGSLENSTLSEDNVQFYPAEPVLPELLQSSPKQQQAQPHHQLASSFNTHAHAPLQSSSSSSSFTSAFSTRVSVLTPHSSPLLRPMAPPSPHLRFQSSPSALATNSTSAATSASICTSTSTSSHPSPPPPSPSVSFAIVPLSLVLTPAQTHIHAPLHTHAGATSSSSHHPQASSSSSASLASSKSRPSQLPPANQLPSAFFAPPASPLLKAMPPPLPSPTNTTHNMQNVYSMHVTQNMYTAPNMLPQMHSGAYAGNVSGASPPLSLPGSQGAIPPLQLAYATAHAPPIPLSYAQQQQQQQPTHEQTYTPTSVHTQDAPHLLNYSRNNDDISERPPPLATGIGPAIQHTSLHTPRTPYGIATSGNPQIPANSAGSGNLIFSGNPLESGSAPPHHPTLTGASPGSSASISGVPTRVTSPGHGTAPVPLNPEITPGTHFIAPVATASPYMRQFGNPKDLSEFSLDFPGDAPPLSVNSQPQTHFFPENPADPELRTMPKNPLAGHHAEQKSNPNAKTKRDDPDYGQSHAKALHQATTHLRGSASQQSTRASGRQGASGRTNQRHHKDKW